MLLLNIRRQWLMAQIREKKLQCSTVQCGIENAIVREKCLKKLVNFIKNSFCFWNIKEQVTKN